MPNSQSPKFSSELFEEDFVEFALDRGFENLHFKFDPKTGFRAIVAIHNTKLGPALGGCRFIQYPNSREALRDVMRLARGMSFKAASVHLPLGGGKAVIMKPAGNFDREAYMHSFGEFVQEINGRYITALDSGTELSDMDIIGEHTPYVASLSRYDGDPSPYTARGVFRGIQAAVNFKTNKDSLDGLHVAVQGMGHVGFELGRLLNEEGVRLTVSDVDKNRVAAAIKAFGAQAVDTAEIHKTDCDIYAPCALGAILNEKTIPEIRARTIAGAANNQLANEDCGRLLHEAGILLAVDYVINAGGLIYAANRYFREPDEKVNDAIEHIYDSLMLIFERSAKDDVPCNEIADHIAEEYLA